MLRQPVGKPRASLWTFACAVGGRGEGAWGRLMRAFGAGWSGRVAADGHFSARTAAALPLPAEKVVAFILKDSDAYLASQSAE